MTLNLLFSAREELWDEYLPHLRVACSDLGLEVALDTQFDPQDVDYIIYAPNPSLKDFAPFHNCKAVLSLWAGVESIAPNTSLTQPLARLADTGLKQGMREWVAGHVLRHHLGMDRHITNPDAIWRPIAPPLANERHVSFLGLGELGAACAKTLSQLGFRVTGWSRSLKTIEGVDCKAGSAGLKQALTSAEILVLLLPLTADTENLLNQETLALLPKGATIINPGRGALVDDQALLDALDTGQVDHATLDVFRIEPLPKDHPYWAHPKVTVTPHIASETRPETAALQIAENIRRGEAGEPFMNLVDRARGY